MESFIQRHHREKFDSTIPNIASAAHKAWIFEWSYQQKETTKHLLVLMIYFLITYKRFHSKHLFQYNRKPI